MKDIGDGGVVGEAKRVALRLHAEPEDPDLDARRQDEMEVHVAFIEILDAKCAALHITAADVGRIRIELEGDGRFRLDQRHVLRGSGIDFDLHREEADGGQGKAEGDKPDGGFHGRKGADTAYLPPPVSRLNAETAREMSRIIEDSDATRSIPWSPATVADEMESPRQTRVEGLPPISTGHI